MRPYAYESVLLPGDLGLTNSFRAPKAHTRLLARAIAALSRTWREPPTRATHAFIVLGYGQAEDITCTPGMGFPMNQAVLIESQTRTREGRLYDLYAGTGKEVSIWRLRGLGNDARLAIALKALSYRDAKYGWWKLLAHIADWHLGGVYLVRRILFVHRYPMCSWVAAHAYDAVGYRFGKAPDAIQPDDLWDWVTSVHRMLPPDSEEWECIRPLSPIEREP